MCKNLVLIAVLIITIGATSLVGQPIENPKVKRPLKVGYSVPIKAITKEKMQYAKSVGIDYIEIGGLESLIDHHLNFLDNDEDIIDLFRHIKSVLDETGIRVWSIHMPGNAYTDISLFDENRRIVAVNMHLKLLGFLEIFEPEILLFHASHFVAPDQREFRKTQALKSAITLNEKVKQIRGTMVIENGGGNTTVEEGVVLSVMPRSIAEMLEFMSKLPKSIGVAVDMNHIAEPHKLIIALGDRLKSVHINDGNGERCYHYFPCSGEGENDWNKILAALDIINYNGVFMYESKYDDEKDLIECYIHLYNQYKASDLTLLRKNL
mgnify:CR=1 FL=1